MKKTRHFTGKLTVFALGALGLQVACASDDSDASASTDTSSSTDTSGSSTDTSSSSNGPSTTSTASSGGTSGNSTSTSGAAGASGNDGGGSGEADLAVGTFEIEMVPEEEETATSDARDAFTSIIGRVYEYPVPSQIDWQLEEEQDGCRLLVPRIPFCDPACSGGAVCSENDECVAFPETYDLGEVTLSGIATETGALVNMDPLPPSNTYQPLAGAALTYPPFAAGDEVALQTEGGDLQPFGITATGIDELVLLEPQDTLPFAPDEPAELSWEAAEAEGSHIEVVIDISHHGGQKGEIVCEAPDDGSLTIPAALVTGLVDLGFSGYPTVLISRISLGSTNTGAGRVDLKLVNAIELPIEIPGLVSCQEAGSTDECPDGETCQNDLKCG